MKRFNKQILEAINRGIQLALDDYEEQLNNPITPKREVIKNSNSVKELLWLHDNFIDLNLPSGTLWAKYNLGVDPNKLSKPEDWYGDYYAWGETIPNKPDGYNWKTYQFDNYLIKYNEEDHLTELQLIDDPAYLNIHLYNFKFKMPSKADFEELRTGTNNEWVENFNNSGVNGCRFTSKLDSSKYIFLPAAGCHHGANLGGIGGVGQYGSSSLNTDYPYEACNLYFYNRGVGMSYDDRCIGFSVRPVINL